METLLKNQYVRLALALLAGIVIGVVFYPSKKVEERTKMKMEEEFASTKEKYEKQQSSSKEEYDSLKEQYSKYTEESSNKITSLTVKIHNMESKQKTSYFKVVKPDGTIEIKKFSESEVKESDQAVTQIQQEFKQKIESIENKWESTHKKRVEELKKEFSSKEQDYKKKIQELETSKVTSVNEKHSSAEAGYTIDGKTYLHATTSIAGPIMGGIHVDTGKSFGVGVGISF